MMRDLSILFIHVLATIARLLGPGGAGSIVAETLLVKNQLVIANRARNLSSDNDPLFKFHRWKANLRVLDVEEVKTVPYVPLSHPFVEGLIGTVRREFLDHVPFWGAIDLERKSGSFKTYFNHDRTHRGLGGEISDSWLTGTTQYIARPDDVQWKSCYRGLYQLPIAA